MVKLALSRKYPFLSLTDIGLRRQVDRLRVENDDLRARIVSAQQEKAVAQQQSEQLRKEKERLRLRVASLKQAAEAERKVHELLQAKIQALREENEELGKEGARG
jgi:chromosome segregation ATPase